MKNPKSLETKLRSAIRLIWSRSSERRAILKSLRPWNDFDTKQGLGYEAFECPLCKKLFPIQMFEVDHIEPVGTLELTKITEWVDKLFHSPQRAICKLCHRRKTTADRKKMRTK